MARNGLKRKLTAILSADVEGYSRLMGNDEASTIHTLTVYKEAMTALIKHNRGRVVDSPGDNLLAEFASVVDAVQCAVEIQRDLAERNQKLSSERRMQFRIGVNLGDVVEEEDRIYGDGVNITARLESICEGGGVCISGAAFEHVENKLDLKFEDLGDHEVKNITKPVRVYKVSLPHDSNKSNKGETLELPDKLSIAVLPFDNMSGNPGQEYFCDGLTEEIISGLSKVSDLFVIARNSTFVYKGKQIKVQQVGQELGVRYVLEGSVRTVGDRVRITAQLIDTTTQHHLWAERFDRDMQDILALQDDITKQILISLQVKLTEGEQVRLYGKGTEILEAYLKHLQGHQYARLFNKEGNFLARQMFEEAIALDPNYAMAYIYLAIIYVLDVWLGVSSSPEESLMKATELVKKALSIDETLPEAHGILGLVSILQKQHDKAISEIEIAVKSNPNSADDHSRMGLAVHYAGKPEEAIVWFKKALRLNPTPPIWYLTSLGAAYAMAGQYEEALEIYKRALQRGSDNLIVWQGLAMVYILSGRKDEARAAAENIIRIDPKFSLDYFSKMLPYKNQSDLECEINALRGAGLK
jgi:adenylate cyclase